MSIKPGFYFLHQAKEKLLKAVKICQKFGKYLSVTSSKVLKTL